MVLSRFWYVLLALVLGSATYGTFVAVELHNRTGQRLASESLISDAERSLGTGVSLVSAEPPKHPSRSVSTRWDAAPRALEIRSAAASSCRCRCP